MSRSFTPPSTLSQQDIRTIADVRRDIWTNSFHGMGYGSVTGIVAHTIASLVTRSKQLNRNTALFSFLAGGALGSFLAATVTGKNQVHQLHPIFQIGATGSNSSGGRPDTGGDSSPPLVRAKEREEQLRTTLERRHSNVEPSSQEDILRNRMLRRKTLQNALLHQNGLNDSHGGHWVEK